MKKIYLFVLAALFFVSCSQNKLSNSLKSMGINGNVTNITDTVWEVKEKFGEPIKIRIDKLIKYEINDKGNITSITKYGATGKISEKTVKEYNEEELILSDKTYIDDGSLYSSYIYTYTDDGNYKIDYIRGNYKSYIKFERINDKLTKRTEFREDESKSEMKLHYDDNMRIVKIEGIDSNNYLEEYELTYKDNLTTSYLYRSKYGSIKEDYKYKLDNKGNWIEKIEYHTDDYDNKVPSLEKMTTRNLQYK